MWIHKHKNWPDFTWDAEHLASRLAKIRHRQGRLLGRMENLGFELKQEASLNTLTNDMKKTRRKKKFRLANQKTILSLKMCTHCSYNTQDVCGGELHYHLWQ